MHHGVGVRGKIAGLGLLHAVGMEVGNASSYIDGSRHVLLSVLLTFCISGMTDVYSRWLCIGINGDGIIIIVVIIESMAGEGGVWNSSLIWQICPFNSWI